MNSWLHEINNFGTASSGVGITLFIVSLSGYFGLCRFPTVSVVLLTLSSYINIGFDRLSTTGLSMKLGRVIKTLSPIIMQRRSSDNGG